MQFDTQKLFKNKNHTLVDYVSKWWKNKNHKGTEITQKHKEIF